MSHFRGQTGGAIWWRNSLVIKGCTFANNVCGIDDLGQTNTVQSSRGSYYSLGGGAIYYHAYSGLTAQNCTFVGNHAFGKSVGLGGALYVFTYLVTTYHDLVNCTLVGNVADSTDGALYRKYFNGSHYAVAIKNCIVAGNTVATNNDLTFFTSGIAGSDPLYLISNSLVGVLVTNIFGTNTLANNGGLTPTIALNPKGLAINAGNNSFVTNDPDILVADQRGQSRINGGTVDIGAFEFQFTPPPPFTINSINGSLRFTWPASDYPFRLQAAATLKNASWSDAAATITQTNSVVHTILPSPSGTQFFRLAF